MTIQFAENGRTSGDVRKNGNSLGVTAPKEKAIADK
jgi:hypothetical protein